MIKTTLQVAIYHWPSFIATKSLRLVQKLDKMYFRKEPKKFGTIPIDWFK